MSAVIEKDPTAARTEVLPRVAARPLGSAPAPGGPPERPTLTASRCSAAVLVYLALAVAVPVGFVDWSRNSSTAINTVMCLALISLSAWRLTEVITLGRRAILRTLFYVFVYVFVAMPALAQSVSGVYPLDGLSYAPSTVSTGLVHFVIGVLAYEAGWAATGVWWRRHERPVDVDRPPLFAFSRARSALLGVVGLGFTWIVVARTGIETFFTSREETTAALTGADSEPFYMAENKTSGILVIFLSQFLVFVALFAILYSRKHGLWPRSGLVSDTVWRLFIVVLALANVVMNNPFGNGRWWFCLVAVAFVSIYLPLDRRHAERYYALGALLVLFFSFASLDAYRTSTSTLEISGPGSTLVQNGTYAMFQMELNGVRYVEDNGHTDGRQMLGTALGFVPRTVWEDKPIPTGQVVDPQYARAATAWTETQVDFGAVGVVVFFLLYGAGSHVLTDRSRRVPPGMLHAAIPILAAFQIFFLRGSLMPAMGSLYQLIAAFVCVAAFFPTTLHAPSSRPHDP